MTLSFGLESPLQVDSFLDPDHNTLVILPGVLRLLYFSLTYSRHLQSSHSDWSKYYMCEGNSGRSWTSYGVPEVLPGSKEGG